METGPKPHSSNRTHGLSATALVPTVIPAPPEVAELEMDEIVLKLCTVVTELLLFVTVSEIASPAQFVPEMVKLMAADVVTVTRLG